MPLTTYPGRSHDCRTLQDWVTLGLGSALLPASKVVDHAAARLGKNRSDFMLEVACREAENVLLDQRYFHLSDSEFKKFTAALDRAPVSNPRLRRLLRTNAPWDK